MSLNRYATKRDRTEAPILRAIARAGASYIRLDPFDHLVLFRGQITMLECKTKTGRATQNQQDLVRLGWPLKFVKTPEEALAAIGAEVR